MSFSTKVNAFKRMQHDAIPTFPTELTEKEKG